ncbi:MAG: ribonuclease H-like domain-containing protein [Gammaproteobacteria bacterium]
MESTPPQNDVATPHSVAAPMRQVVFDLETWGLDRGWGVTMVASFLIHGYAAGTKKVTLTLRDYTAWGQGTRSNDRDMVAAVFDELRPCHIGYAHNGERFDIRWLRTVALKYGLEMPRLKLVDPCMIAWKKYLLGRNSLEAVADFLELSENKGKEKLHISPDVWRHALMDNDDAAWALLVDRCESDVDLLNEVAARVTGDIGMVDYSGSWR